MLAKVFLPDAFSTCFALKIVSQVHLVPPPLQRCAELIAHVSAADRTSLIFSIFEWMVRDEGEDDSERLVNISALLKNVIFENIDQLPAQFQYYMPLEPTSV